MICTFAVRGPESTAIAPRAGASRSRCNSNHGAGVGGRYDARATNMDGWKMDEHYEDLYVLCGNLGILSENVWVESDKLMAVVANLTFVICLQHVSFVDKHAVSYVARYHTRI